MRYSVCQEKVKVKKTHIHLHFFSEAEKLSDRIKMLAEKVTNASEVEAKYVDLSERLDDLLTHVQSSVANSEKAEDILKMLRNMLDNLKVLLGVAAFVKCFFLCSRV